MVKKRSAGEKVFDSFNIIFMLFMIVITLYPFIYVALASFSDSNSLLKHEGLLLTPLNFNTKAYSFVLSNSRIFTGYINTIFVVVVGTGLNLLFTSMGAYVLSRRDLAARKIFSLFIIFTMYFSGGLIPRYILINNQLQMKNSLWVLIVPSLISTWNLLIMRTSFFGIPASVEESARLDGANDFIVLFRIIMPMILPTIAVMVLFYAVGHWNAWFDASLFMRNKDKYPLQLVLREILVLSQQDMLNESNIEDREALGESIKYATIIVTTIPVLIIYPFLQKYFVQGMMIGAVKG